MRKLIAAILYYLTALLPCRIIQLPDGPYLERYYLGKWLGNYHYLHRFVRNDSERHLHDHPWRNAHSTVLTGAYFEERMDLWPIQAQAARQGLHPLVERPRLMDVRRFNTITNDRMGRATLHRITNVLPETWTLFAHGEWEFEWGFYELDAAQQHIISYRPYSPANRPDIDREWWRNAPKGRATNREPFLL